jgi:O-antigen/teichoic acid export membrane protein
MEGTVAAVNGPELPAAAVARPPRASVARNMVDMVSSQFVSFALGIVVTIVQPRFVGPEGIGRVHLAFSIWLIAMVFVGFGTTAYLTLEMAKDHERGRALVGPIMVLRLGLFVVASFVIAIYSWMVGYGDEVLWLLAIAGSTMLLSTLADTISAAFTGLEQMRYSAATSVVAKLVYTLVVVVVLVAGGGVYGLAITSGVNSLLSLVLLWVFYRRFAEVTFARPSGGYRALVASSSGFLLAGAVIVIYLQIDMVAMSLLVGDDALGWYAAADGLMGSLFFIPTIMISTLFPVIGRLHADDTRAVEDIVRRAVSILMLAGVAVGFGVAVVAEPFCALLLGEEFRPAGQVLSVLGLAAPFMFTTMMLGTLAQATGRKRFWTTLMSAAIVVSVGFDIIFVPLMDEVAGNGAIGGALGYVVTESLMVGIAIWKMAPHTVDRSARIRLGKIYLAGATMVAAAWPLREHFLIIPVAVGACVFVAMVVLLRILTDDERDMLRRLGGRVPILSSRLHGGVT